MNPFQLMEFHKQDFTQNDLTIYQAIVGNPDQVTYKTISRLAEDCGVSQPAISRFVKGLGYTRYQDFRSDLIAHLAMRTRLENQNAQRLGYFTTLYQTLEEAEKLLTAGFLQDLAQYVCGFEHIYASGIRKSYHPAQLLEQLMRKNRRFVQAVSRDALADTAAYMGQNDLLMLFSVSGSAQIMQQITEANGKVLLVTANPHFDNPGAVDRVVLLPYASSDPETSSISPVLFDIFVELLVGIITQNG